jgi:acetyltransferase-like isoleucine patch superfamily enzyme
MRTALDVHPDAFVDPDARIYPSVRGTRISIGARTRLEAFAVIRAVGGSGDVTIGEDCYINQHCVLFSGNGIRIGNRVLLAPGVKVMPANHSVANSSGPTERRGFMSSRGGVVIEDDVWIGANAVLLDGTFLARGSVVGAGSVINARTTELSTWAGVPARHVKDRPTNEADGEGGGDPPGHSA